VTLPGCSYCQVEMWSYYSSYWQLTNNYVKWMVSPNQSTNSPDFTWSTKSKSAVYNSKRRYRIYNLNKTTGFSYTTPCVEVEPPKNMSGLFTMSYSAGQGNEE
jgi:hypothetical protein